MSGTGAPQMSDRFKPRMPEAETASSGVTKRSITF